MKIFTCKFVYVVLLLNTLAFSAETDAFKITVKTDNLGDSNNTTFTIPTFPGESYDYSVDCGNGTTTIWISGDFNCSYTSAGTYQIKIYDTFPRIYFNNQGDKDKILSIDQWGIQQWSSMNKAFYGCSNLTINAADTPDLSHVTDMSMMFHNAANFNSAIGNWDVSNVKAFSLMFADSAFNQDLSNWNLSSAKHLTSMFVNTPFNQDISRWNVATVEDFSYMFSNTLFNKDIGGWNTASAKYLTAMFKNSSFNQYIGNWNLFSAKNMLEMFSDNTVFNQDIGDWDVSNVRVMDSMFSNASAFNQDISDWNVGSLISASGMFDDISVSNYNNMLNSWAKLTLASNVTFDAGSHTTYTRDANVSHEHITSTFSWSLNDLGEENGFHILTPYHFSAKEGEPIIGTVISNHTENNCYSISGGADGALFDIDSISGLLSFKTPPHYNNPNDKNSDGAYRVQVHATDCKGAASDYQTVRVTVESNGAALVPIINYLLFP